MPVLTSLIWAAGAVQLVILAANFALPEKLHCRENLARLADDSPGFHRALDLHPCGPGDLFLPLLLVCP